MIQPGMILQERYRVIRELGKGGFAKAFEVDDRGTLKVLKVLHHNYPIAVSLLQREAEVLSRLHHPGIPRVEKEGYFTCFVEFCQEPLHCLVMERIEGKNLQDWLLVNQHITQERAINWLTQLTEILAQVHQHQYFHRDIKPSNIMLKTDGQLVLIDFGAVREVTQTYVAKLEGRDVTGIISVGFTPPEQVEGQAVLQSDFFALGRTFVYLLTGEHPRNLKNPQTGELIWRDMAPQVSKPLANLIDEMMASFPANRPRNAQDILQRLAAIYKQSSAETEVIQTRTIAPWPTVSPPANTFYVERQPIESRCYKEILRPGSLIRIKAPRRMGKTLLMNKILAHAANSGFKTVRLNFEQAEGKIFSNLDKFLRWFCANVSRQLHLAPMLDDYWDEEVMGSMMSCTSYFEGYLLEQIDSPLVLGLDEVNAVFQYGGIAQDFFPLLRNWHEEANNLEIWQKLRMVVVHSTEVYIPLKINQSPFNVGLAVELSELSRDQVQDLARRYELDWSGGELEHLMSLVGGHPDLVRVAFEHISRQEVTWEQLWQTAATESGIYNNHLRRLLGYLLEDMELACAFKKVVTTDTSVTLDPMQAYKLHSMGLVHLQGDDCTPICDLYRQYFRNHLFVEC